MLMFNLIPDTMLTEYFNYDTQKYHTDKEGFETFHINELDYLTSEAAKKIIPINDIKCLVMHHISKLKFAGLTGNISEGFYNYIK